MTKVLLVYYHPVVFDICKTLKMLDYDVTLAINLDIKDNYGTGFDIIKKAKNDYKSYINVIPLTLALAHLNQKKFDLVGCDGVFSGDKMVMEVCDKNHIPYFCIQGYPNVFDEPSNNILSLGWFTPSIFYNQRFPSEGHKKEIDWKDIEKTGRSSIKNFCVFYPVFHDLKEKIEHIKNFKLEEQKGFISLIQGYKKWNKHSYEVFNQISGKIKNVENLQGKSHKECHEALWRSRALLHLKWADQPGIAIFEAMLSGKAVLTMNSFVLSSMNQEVLISDYNSIIADDVDELIEHMQPEYYEYLFHLGENAKKHANILTGFGRQRFKLIKFINRCLND